jgi:teichoic acid transport system ATP-binding protein
MTENAITAEGLSKKYKVYRNNKARLAEFLAFGRKQFHQEFWALRDLNFTIKRGETFGVIGRNGAGKSTLLKILAGITRQSEGSMHINGRLSALLELGAGFHPDFTGRENLYMNGALIGYTREDVDAIFEEVVDFADLWDYIDMPVKTYSSGMYVRLAFSIATSVNPDILIVDEALAVGDEYFQKKCIDRMRSFMQLGKTIIFVSHDVGNIRRICQRAMWIEKGGIMDIGDSDSVTASYSDFLNGLQGEASEREKAGKKAAPAHEKLVEITGVRIIGADRKPHAVFRTGETFKIEVGYRALKPVRDVTFGVAIYRNDNVFVTASNTSMDDILRGVVIEGPGSYVVSYNELPLLSGTYRVTAGILDEKGIYRYDYHDRLYEFIVRGAAPAEGMILIPHEWEFTGGGKTVKAVKRDGRFELE